MKKGQKAPPKPNAKSVVATLKDVAAHFNVHPRTVDNWKKRGMPIAAKSRYDLLEIEEWADDEGLLEGKVHGYAQRYQKEKYLHEKARREKVERENLVAAGRLMDIEEVKRINREVDLSIKSDLLAIPSKVAPFLEGMTAREIQRKLEEAIDDALRHISGRSV